MGFLFKHLCAKPTLRRQTQAPAPCTSPGHDTMDLKQRQDSESISGTTERLSWGARSDVGLVRGHNEDSFLLQSPLFAVCDGMGGHAAGEVASSIAIKTLADKAPAEPNDILLGAAVEAANLAIIDAAKNGEGKPGMGSTCTCVLISNDRMSIAHAGDSRLYLLHSGALVRLTHDHSYVEELVDAGEITADEARVHPSRSVITRALGSDPEMYADHFTLNASTGDRLILCSDGLSSMIDDSDIESIAISSATPQAAADGLVAAALTAGGHDNVTVIVIDVLSDGVEEFRRAAQMKFIRRIFFVLLVLCALCIAIFAFAMNASWYLGAHNGKVCLYHGLNYQVYNLKLSQLDTKTEIKVSDLPQTTQELLDKGVSVGSLQEARDTLKSYRQQIEDDKKEAAATSSKAKDDGTSTTTADTEGAQ